MYCSKKKYIKEKRKDETSQNKYKNQNRILVNKCQENKEDTNDHRRNIKQQKLE